MSIKIRRVLVTGASKGIGKETAITLAKQGFYISVHYHSDKAGAEDTLQQINDNEGQGDIIQFDMTNREQCEQTLTATIEANGAFYGIVNNAGVCKDMAFPAMSGDTWDAVVHTNLDSFYNVIKPCVMPMIQLRQGGRIVTLSSVSGIAGNRGQVNYSAAKAGIIGASKALALELAKRDITVNCVAPGVIETDMIAELEDDMQHVLKMIPARRVGQVHEVASLINYLMSDDASYLTRQVISVNGGLI
jgi:3-oxoacyl-[acyl-carrier protein] reductase